MRVQIIYNNKSKLFYIFLFRKDTKGTLSYQNIDANLYNSGIMFQDENDITLHNSENEISASNCNIDIKERLVRTHI